MNNGRMWTIVSPTVGVPVFFLALMLTSLFIHYQVLSRTTWFPEFIAGPAADVADSNGGR